MTNRHIRRWALLLSLSTALPLVGAAAEAPIKERSSLYPPSVVERVRGNAGQLDWAKPIRGDLIEAARWWVEQSDDELWGLMFGPRITRSWMVWSNGFCPACKASVPMYNWQMDALGRPWKTRCPHCQELFPKNDFYAFYQSGLDAQGVYDPALADRALLFNAEHPDADDPLHGFGVDDGEGYVEGEHRWRFIGAYLIYGQWKQAVIGGIRTLAAAYVLTGEPVYAHKAGVLLDRVADLYPTFDFGKQALVYERQGDRGYVSTWHDACEETREMVLAYDMVFEGLRKDTELVSFLSGKAAAYGLENPKASWADIQRNIEGRILRDALANRPKITTNYPRTEIAVAITLAVLGWPANRDAFYAVVDPMLDKATAVDGVTGEKGLAGYTSFTIQALALFLAEMSRCEPGFLNTLIERHPRLKETYRFHIDTLCLDRYYPLSGDTGGFAMPMPAYAGMTFLRPGKNATSWSVLPPSCYTLLWGFYEATGDPAYVQIAYRGNGNSTESLPYDLYAAEPEAIRQGIEEVLDQESTQLRLGSVNKTQWHLAILRSGEDEHARAVWLDYDSGGGHGHQDGMNLGLFAKGLDLMPDFGYPPVQFGGWTSPRARWYTMSAAHNTVVVDGQNSPAGAGETTLWADGRYVHAVSAAAPALNGTNRFERTVILVDVSPTDCYVVDIFRVAGGAEHTKFMHSHFGEVSIPGLDLEAAPDYGHNTQMRNVRMDPLTEPGWQATWTVEDRYKLLPEDRQIHVRYTDWTTGASAGLLDAWVVAGMFGTNEETWIPRVLVRRTAVEDVPLESTFVGVIEPYEKTPVLSASERFVLQDVDEATLGDGDVGLKITLTDGRCDILVIRNPGAGAGNTATAAPDGLPQVATDAKLCFVRFAANGSVHYAAISQGAMATTAGDFNLRLPQAVDFLEQIEETS